MLTGNRFSNYKSLVMPRQKKKISEEENQKPFFFNSFNVPELPLNKRLPVTEILKKENKKSSFFIRFSVKNVNGLLNIFLYVNGLKKDMLYQVKPGIHSFSFIPDQKENLVELFYTAGNSRSISTSFILQQGEK